MKRFTETDKWKNPEFRRLSDSYKLLYLLLLDECDNAGVVHIDLERFGFILKRSFTIEEIKENLGDKLHFFGSDKLVIKNFVRFQCGELNDKSHPHRRVRQLLHKHGLTDLYEGHEI
jgi:hypothetical protein